MIFAAVPFREVADFIKSNQLQHYADASEIAEHDLPDIDFDYYLQASDANMCVAIVAINDEKEIVGYSVFLIGNAPNHKSIIEANNTAIWVKKEYRGRLSVQLVREAEKILFATVDEICYSVPSDKIGGFLGQLGYRSQYTLWRARKDVKEH